MPHFIIGEQEKVSEPPISSSMHRIERHCTLTVTKLLKFQYMFLIKGTLMQI